MHFFFLSNALIYQPQNKHTHKDNKMKTKCSHQRKTEGRKRIKIKNGKDSYKNKSSNSTPRLYSRELKTYVHTETRVAVLKAASFIITKK